MSESDLLSIFRVEVEEYLELLNGALLQVEMLAETDSPQHSTLVEMNRIAHSMKGAARAVGFSTVETLGHYMEDIFGAVMKNSLRLTPDACDTLYDSLDVIQSVVRGDEVDQAWLSDVIARLEQMVAQSVAGAGAISPEAGQNTRIMPVVASDDDAYRDEPRDARATDAPRSPSPANPPVTPASLGQRVAQSLTPSRRTILSPISTPTDGNAPAAVDSQTLALRPVEETLRVTVGKMDRLMAEATELIVARMRGEERQNDIRELRRIHTRWQREWRGVRSSYIRLVRRLQEHEYNLPEVSVLFKFLEVNQRYLQETSRRLNQLAQAVAQDNLHLTMVSDQVQEEIDAMRLIPFDTLVGGFQRMVRDLARDMGKTILFDVTGAYVEIDKTVLDALREPLLHLLRNAVDHGVETPEARQAAGKPPTGRVMIHVEQRGAEIIISVSDDGSGIDPERVRQAVVRNQVLTQAEADALSDDDVRFYIFHAGLSTSDTVTTISGRGFGMDIVRERVEGLRGRIALESRRGEGTTFTINVPVSLTRIRCIMVQIGEEKYAIPSVVVERMETLDRGQVFTAEGREMVTFGDQTVPLVSMGAALRVASTAGAGERVPVLLLRSVSRTIAFEVDQLLSEQELVLKPLGAELARARFVAGAALLGTGQVVIVLDANDLVRAASGVVLPRKTLLPVGQAARQRRLRVLVADDSITTRTLEKNILETAGFEVHVAIDGVEAWSMLAEIDFDVVISDVEMPRMNGLELTAQIKSSQQYRDIPVILLTSLSKPEQRAAGLRAGAEAYLVKSQFDQGELLATIQAVL